MCSGSPWTRSTTSRTTSTKRNSSDGRWRPSLVVNGSWRRTRWSEMRHCIFMITWFISVWARPCSLFLTRRRSRPTAASFAAFKSSWTKKCWCWIGRNLGISSQITVPLSGSKLDCQNCSKQCYITSLDILLDSIGFHRTDIDQLLVSKYFFNITRFSVVQSPSSQLWDMNYPVVF